MRLSHSTAGRHRVSLLSFCPGSFKQPSFLLRSLGAPRSLQTATGQYQLQFPGEQPLPECTQKPEVERAEGPAECGKVLCPCPGFSLLACLSVSLIAKESERAWPSLGLEHLRTTCLLPPCYPSLGLWLGVGDGGGVQRVTPPNPACFPPTPAPQIRKLQPREAQLSAQTHIATKSQREIQVLPCLIFSLLSRSSVYQTGQRITPWSTSNHDPKSRDFLQFTHF